MITKIYKIYGIDGHRQKESFNKSYTITLENSLVHVLNADHTGSNQYTILSITSETENDCISILDSQLSDGIFENCRTGRIEKIA